MTEHPPRLFADDAAIRKVGLGLLACTLPRENWTHEAHLAACSWLLIERPEIAISAELPGIIRRYNESVGGVNDDSQGYHETITQGSIVGIAALLRERDSNDGLVGFVNALLQSPVGRREWLLDHYSRARLFSVEARRGFVPPDLAALPD